MFRSNCTQASIEILLIFVDVSIAPPARRLANWRVSASSMPLKMEGSLKYENREEIIPRRATGYDRTVDGHVRILHHSTFDVAAVAEDRFEFSFHLKG